MQAMMLVKKCGLDSVAFTMDEPILKAGMCWVRLSHLRNKVAKSRLLCEAKKLSVTLG